MSRIISAIVLSSILVGLSLMSDEFGDTRFTLQNWISSFVLPIWSLGVISLWYDTGRLIWSKTFKVDSPDSVISLDKRATLFIGWMSVVFAYVVWAHISLLATPMLLVLPFLGHFLQDYLFQDWTRKPNVTNSHILTILIWASMSYYTYWILTIGWIVVRVLMLDNLDDVSIFYIQ